MSQGCSVSRQQALAFLNQEGREFEMWKHMMQAAEEFIAGSLFQHFFSPGGHNGFASRPGPGRSNRHRPWAELPRCQTSLGAHGILLGHH